MSKRLPALCSTGDVATALDWDPRTIRRHCVSLAEWKAAVAKDAAARFRTIPSIRFGSGPNAQYKIPRWWVEELQAIRDAPAEPK